MGSYRVHELRAWRDAFGCIQLVDNLSRLFPLARIDEAAKLEIERQDIGWDGDHAFAIVNSS